jgi:hypothetical protein
MTIDWQHEWCRPDVVAADTMIDHDLAMVDICDPQLAIRRLLQHQCLGFTASNVHGEAAVDAVALRGGVIAVAIQSPPL